MITKGWKWALFSILLLVVFAACKKNNFHPQDPTKDYAYFGLTKGRYVEYKVTSITHDSLLAQHDTTTSYYKTVIGDDYYDNEGRLCYEYLRYSKNNLSDSYQFISKWVILIADNKGQLVDENQRMIKLVFPITSGQEWQSNAYNYYDEQEAHYEGINVPFSDGSFSTDSSVTVQFYKYKTLIDDRLEEETYAKNIGLISKISRELYYQFGYTTPYKGTELTYSIIFTGIE